MPGVNRSKLVDATRFPGSLDLSELWRGTRRNIRWRTRLHDLFVARWNRQRRRIAAGFNARSVGGRRAFRVYKIDRREDGTLYEFGHGAMGVTYRATDTTLQ